MWILNTWMETFRILTTCVWSHVKSIAFIADKNYFEIHCNMPASPTPRHMKFHLQIRQLQLQYEASSQIFYCCLFVNWSEQKLIMKVCGHRTRVGWQLSSDKLIFCIIYHCLQINHICQILAFMNFMSSSSLSSSSH